MNKFYLCFLFSWFKWVFRWHRRYVRFPIKSCDELWELNLLGGMFICLYVYLQWFMSTSCSALFCCMKKKPHYIVNNGNHTNNCRIFDRYALKVTTKNRTVSRIMKLFVVLVEKCHIFVPGTFNLAHFVNFSQWVFNWIK